MIVFGTKAKGIDSSVVNTVCPSCSQSPHALHIFQKYFHIFWIPVFPLGKISVLECQHCKKTTTDKDLNALQGSMAQAKRKEAKTPLYMYAGSVLLASLIGWGAYSVKDQEAKTRSYLEQPRAHDMAVIESKGKEFQILQLLSVEAETVKFKIGNYLYKSALSAKKAIREGATREESYFAEEIFEMPTSKYKGLEIEFIHREE